MQALVQSRPGARQFEIIDVPIPTPTDEEVLIEVYASGVCGSEVHRYLGHGGPLTYPKVLGHEYSGTIAAVGKDVGGLAEGDRVIAESSAGCEQCIYCRRGFTNLCYSRRSVSGSFARFVSVPARYVYQLPDHISLKRATLSEPLACVINGVIERTAISPGDLVAVIGPGPIGLLAALLAEQQGAEVVLIGRSSSNARLQIAEHALGFSHVVRSDITDIPEYVDSLNPNGVDVVLDCAGGSSAVNLGFEIVRKEGAFTELALFNTSVDIDFEAVLRKEIRVTGAVSHRPSSWNKLLQLYEQDRMSKAELLITEEFPLDRWQDAFESMISREAVKPLVFPSVE